MVKVPSVPFGLAKAKNKAAKATDAGHGQGPDRGEQKKREKNKSGGQDDQEVLILEKAVPAQIWLGVGEKGFVFPELSKDARDRVAALVKKPSLAVCLSGGGMRAATKSLGWVRSLRDLGLLQKARYLCSNSGGSWFNAPFSYQTMANNDEFLGPHIPPSALSVEMLDAHGRGGYAHTLDEANIIKRFAKEIFGNLFTNLKELTGRGSVGVDKVRAWSEAVAECFLEPHGVGDFKSSFALEGASANRARKAGVAEVYTAMRDSEMPFPIICGCVVAREDSRRHFSYEFTPLYCGVPARIEDAKPMKLGGVLLEPFAHNSSRPAENERPSHKERQVKGGRRTMELHLDWVLPLAQVAGISSQAIAAGFQRKDHDWLWDTIGCPELPIWNALDYASESMAFADGGLTDNLAIFPPLRRGIQKMVICVAISEEPTGDKSEWMGNNHGISGYFGRCEEGDVPRYGGEEPDVKAHNRLCQVFEAEEWDELVEEVFDLHRAGHPIAVLRRLRVLPNSAQGVNGGYDVDTLWFFNGGLKRWQELLPKKTRDHIAPIVKRFNVPFVPTAYLDLPPEVVTIMNQLAGWNVRQAQGKLEELLTGGKSSAAKN